jgi:hypothetical protein
MVFYHPDGCGQLVCAAGGLVGLGAWQGEGPAKMEARALVRQREKQTYIDTKHLECSCLIENAECRGAVGFKAATSKKDS